MPRVISVMPIRSLQMKAPKDTDKETGQAPTHRTEISTKDRTYQLAKPLVVTMSLFGLFCLKGKGASVTRIYSVFILLIFCVSFIQLVFTYYDMEFGVDSFLKIVSHVWYFHCCVNAIVTLKACNCKHRFARFLSQWSRLLKTNRGISVYNPCPALRKYERQARRKCSLVLCFVLLAIITNSVWNTYFLFKTPMTDFTIAPMPPTHPLAFWVKVMVNCVHIYRSAAWFCPTALFVMMAGVIYREFEVFHSDLRNAVSPDGDIVGLESFRRRHQEICQMVETADDVLSGFNAGGIVLSTLNGMLILYSLVYNPAVRSDPIVLAAHCFWLGGVLMYLLLITYFGGYLNHMAHAPLKTIHGIQVKDTSLEFSLQMNMFLNKLTGESIGLTALDMFVIDKPTILTIIGLFITYFIVLIQFQQTTQSSPDVSTCNCTDVLINSTFQCNANYLG